MVEIIVDNFAGGGGASTGIELAIGRSVDIAINHDPMAIAMHKANHPTTEHYIESVWDVDPVKACKGRPVGLAWFSPDCKHFSKAKGSAPKNKNIRGLAWIAIRWAKKVRPRVLMIENVEEFKTWGPLDDEGYPIKERQGEIFRHFIKQLEKHGYVVEHRELRACDYGAPTKRKRFFLIARSDGMPIIWPEPTHAPKNSLEVRVGLLKPYKSAADIIDWSVPTKSIFNREKPLAPNTMERIARGLKKFVFESDDPYIVNDDGTAIASYLIQYHSKTTETGVRGQEITGPVLTIDSSPRYGLVSSHIIQMNNNMIGHSVNEPLNTIVAGPGHIGEVRAFLIKYYGQGTGQSLNEPLDTVVSKDRFGLVEIKGEKYQIADIGLRMLEPRELFDAQGFPHKYIIDKDYTGRQYPKTEQIKRCGNAVPPPFAKALVEANLPELCIKEMTA